MVHTPEKATRTQWEAIQHAVGLNLIDVAGWVGPGVAAAWLWTAERSDTNPPLPGETPVIWLGRMVNTVGIGDHWATTVDAWLHARLVLFWVLILFAVLVSGRALKSGAGAMANLTFVALLAAMSIHSEVVVVAAYLGFSFTACLVAIAMDHWHVKVSAEPTYVSYPRLALELWWSGPLMTVGVMVLAPLILLRVAVSHYRIPRDVPSTPGILYGLEAEDLSSVPLSETPANVALPFLAKAILLSAEEEHRWDSIRSLDRKVAIGARGIVRDPQSVRAAS
ncbi:hypothetical protein [Nocardia brasiliensis]|uniref:hypothetical protein n=1 Tax=Nocardia brasiliensis TaxID=37326 RepID=UPI0018954F4E|nr:hypothetical protein [Nocardia brasiliensis]MBF6546974.1 hypothetical protein [Nocardia brasiliensis]